MDARQRSRDKFNTETKAQPMINLNDIRPGQRITCVLRHDCDAMNGKMLRGSRTPAAPANPLWGRVTRVVHMAGNAAGTETYNRKCNALDIAPAGAPSAWMDTELPCVVALRSNPERRAVRVVNSAVQHVELYVDGRPALPEEEALFAQWKKASGGENPTGYANFAVDNLANAVE